MKAVADTLAVARSNLIERVSRRAKSRRPYRKAGGRRAIGADPPAGGSAQPTGIGVSGASLTGSERPTESRQSMASVCCGSCRSTN